MHVVIEAIAEALHLPMQLLFAGMGERRMSDVVHQRERLGELCVQAELRGNRARDLRDLNRVCQAISKMVRDAGRENLGLVFEATERAGMHNAIAIALELIAVWVRQFGKAAAASVLDGKTQTRKRVHFGSSLMAVRACRLTAARSLDRSGSSSLRAA